MRTEIVNSHELKLYSSIDEMPISVYHKYNKCLLIDIGVGSGAEAIENKISSLARYVNANNKKAIANELANLRLSLYMTQNEISPKLMSLVAMCYSIDGEIITDYSDENLQVLLQKINDAKYSNLVDLFNQVKKKNRKRALRIFSAVFRKCERKRQNS